MKQMLFWNYWLGHGNTIFYFIKTKQFCYYLNFFSWKYLLSYLCWLSTSGFKCQRPNIFSLARQMRKIVHQYMVYHNEDFRPLLFIILGALKYNEVNLAIMYICIYTNLFQMQNARDELLSVVEEGNWDQFVSFLKSVC
jgi:hypothetical protein